MTAGLTPSQTVGPYLSIGLAWVDGVFAAEPGSPGGFWLRGKLFDGAGQPVPDGLVESWQADPDGWFASPEDPRGAREYPGFRGYARSSTDSEGAFEIFTVKPGRVPDGQGGLQAPHIDLSVFARGMLDRVVTRVYFEDEIDANDADPVLALLPDDETRGTLVAKVSADGYRMDIHLQGELETVFFAL
ncbi:protocatechuate 3,4-dioxygenase alpha subunit [Nakamurella sp. UYEF19]|uniref:protocatechuate 3,4-dioxygenase subunit alpha n=1 Tax=Nakamurella sp. UYEF19 TaxID=1756392 RepID=UPI003392B958